MNRDIISKATRNEFREVMTCFTLGEIESMFDLANLVPNQSHIPLSSGQRRSLVEKYYANLAFSRHEDVRKVVAVFEELIFRVQKNKSQWPDDQKRNEALEKLIARMQRDGFRYEGGRFISSTLAAHTLETPSLIDLTAQSIAEHIEKARSKIADRDCAGAITNAYTLVEEFLKEILRQTKTQFKESEGDIRSLYASVSETLNLNPKGENLEAHLRTILQGLKSVIAGLYEVANKASDRHARRYNPAEHHAKLAVNSALAVCEFVLDSYTYQQQMKSRITQG